MSNMLPNDFTWAEELVAKGLATEKRLNGFYHDNFAVTHNGVNYLLRIKREEANAMDPVQFDENKILAELDNQKFSAPKFIYKSPTQNFVLHSFIEGQAVSELFQNDRPLSSGIINEVAEQFATLHQMNWSLDHLQPKTKLSYATPSSFYVWLVDFLADLYHGLWSNEPELYDNLDFPADPTIALRANVSNLLDIDLTLCHGDMHKHNMMITNDQRIIFIDWELALWGDCFYDLAVHVHRSGYSEDEKYTFLTRYLSARKALGDYERFKPQFDAYMDFEAVKSAVVDAYRVHYDEHLPTAGLPKENILKTKLPITIAKAQKVWARNA